jgi:HlyD family secretion protein
MKQFSLAVTLAFGALGCAAPRSDAIEATGVIEVVEVDLAPLTGGRVARVLVEEGDRVAVGDTLLVLEMPTIESDLAQRRARVASARAALAEATAGALPAELTRAEAELAALTADAERAASDARRIAPLAQQDFASAQQKETLDATARTAEARRDASAAQLQLLRDGPRAERVAALRAELAAASASLGALEATARDLVMLAPVAGRVIARSAEPGEILNAGTRALVLAETARQRVRIFVGQTAFPLLQVGDAVTATLDAMPDQPFEGTVASLATQAEYTPRVALTEQERADLLFAVRAEFRDTTETLKAGLPVTVRITPRAN